MYLDKSLQLFVFIVISAMLLVGPQQAGAGLTDYLPTRQTFNPFYWLGYSNRNSTTNSIKRADNNMLKFVDTNSSINVNVSSLAPSSSPTITSTTTTTTTTTTTSSPTTILLVPNPSGQRYQMTSVTRAPQLTPTTPVTTQVEPTRTSTRTPASPTSANSPSIIDVASTTTTTTIATTTTTRSPTTFSPGDILRLFPTPRSKSNITFGDKQSLNANKTFVIYKNGKSYDAGSLKLPKNFTSPSIAFDSSSEQNKIHSSINKKTTQIGKQELNEIGASSN